MSKMLIFINMTKTLAAVIENELGRLPYGKYGALAEHLYVCDNRFHYERDTMRGNFLITACVIMVVSS